MKNKKILSKKKIQDFLIKEKYKNKKIVLCHGAFDIMHIGHINHFQQAKKYGDILVVSVTSDKYIIKGPGRPINNLKNRMNLLASLEVIDFVIESNYPTAIEIIKFIKPDLYCKGPDYVNFKNDVTGKIKDEIIAIKTVKGKIVFTEGMSLSSSKIINQHSNNLSPIQRKFLKKIKSISNAKKIIEKIKLIENKKILVIGETIIDEYIFCEAIGKSGKESILVIQEKNKEKYLGGSAQIANHISNFSKNVTFFSLLGDNNKEINFINSKMNQKIKKIFFTKKNSPTIKKIRYVDVINNNKLIGVYKFNDEEINSSLEKHIITKLIQIIKKFDLVVVADYGHGFITKKIAKKICTNSKFLTLNAQINSSNIGYQRIDKFKNFETLVINESELRHEFRDRIKNKNILARTICKKLKINNIIVTSGKNGALLLEKNNKELNVPAFANKVIDKVGSGDAMLSLISLCQSIKMKNEEIMLVASLAAAQSVESMGNSKVVDKMKLIKSINYILK